MAWLWDVLTGAPRYQGKSCWEWARQLGCQSYWECKEAFRVMGPRAAPALIASFAAEPAGCAPAGRDVAAEILAEMGAGVAPLVVEAFLSHADAAVRAGCGAALRRIGPASMMPLCLAVGGASPEAAAARLVERLRGQDPSQRETLVWALAQFGPAVATALLPVLTDPSAALRRDALEVLGQVARADVSAALVHSLDDPDPQVARSAAALLGKFCGANVVAAEALEALLRTGKPLASEAVEPLARLGPAAVAALVAGLKHPSVKVRREVAQALGSIWGSAAPVAVPEARPAAEPARAEARAYERFTDRTKKVMQLANQEAQRLNHEYIGTEHILLGLVKEGMGVAANVLTNLDIDPRKIRMEVEKIVQAGPDMVTTGKLPQTPRAKKVIEYAIEETRVLGHNYVGTEHLLLGILRERDNVAAQILMNLGLQLDDVRAEVLRLLGPKPQPPKEAIPDIVEEAAEPALAEPAQGALAALAAALADDDAAVRLAVQDALARFGSASVGRVVEVLQADPAAGPAAAEVLGRLGPRAAPAVPGLIAALEDPHAEVRRAAIKALGRLGGSDRAVIPALLRAMADADEPVRKTAESALAQLGSSDALDALLEASGRHEDPTVRAAAVKVLGRCLERLLTSGLGNTARAAALEALAQTDADLSAQLKELNDQIERLNHDKEVAVARQDFKQAASLRDRANKLKKQAGKLQKQADQRQQQAILAVIQAAASDREECVRHAAVEALARIEQARR